MEFVTPVGFRDVLPDEAIAREQIVQRVQALFASAGYAPIETPTLERMDAMNAAGRIPGSTFKLFDATGELLALRPDVTMQVARMVAARLGSSNADARFRYTQRVFRDVDVQSEAREMTQIGVECMGPFGAAADAEVVGLFAQALKLAGLDKFVVALGTVGVLRALLQTCPVVSGEWKNQVLAAYHASNFVELDALCARPEVPQLFGLAIGALPRIRGGRQAIEQARAFVEPLGCQDGLDELEQAFDVLAADGLADSLLVDFSIMSSFDYYTGIVFEAYAPGLGELLGSGGRYDTMLEGLGAPSRPSAGFSFYLEQVMEAMGADAATGAIAAADAAGTGVDAGAGATATADTDATATADADAAATADTGATATAGADAAATAPTRPLRIAVPKGSLNEGSIAALAAAGLDTTGLADPGRSLVISNPGVDYIIVRPTDAPVFVATGAADCGICGKDSLLETDVDVVELVDLGFGGCRFVVAQPEGATPAVEERYRKLGSIRVATKYPNITRRFFDRRGIQVEIVKLHGNIELAPMVGMAERIVDITATGTTLRENNLEIVDEVAASTARFFANAAAFRQDERVVALAASLAEGAEGKEF